MVRNGLGNKWAVTAAVAVAFASTAFGHGEPSVFESRVSTTAVPWTQNKFLNDPADFQFAIVSDRTGGPREGVFEEAVRKLNWLRPEFVISVGDLIQGNSPNASTNAAEWDAFLEMIEPLEMRFFFVAGNHDIQAKDDSRPGKVKYATMRQQWEDRFGATYYSFVYKNALFATLFTNDGVEQRIGDEQVAWFKSVLEQNSDARWTFVFLHHPLWLYAHESNFAAVEDMLQDRKHTVIAGHQHRYLYTERPHGDYYVLASTGGSSSLRGPKFGEFDHVTWVTLEENGPIMANLKLDGILPHDVSDAEQLKRSLSLAESASADGTAIVDDPKQVTKAAVFLNLENNGEYDLSVEGSFLHNHYVNPDPGVVSEVLRPGERRVLEVGLRVVEPFATSERHVLEFHAVYSVEPRGEEKIALEGSTSIPLQQGELNLIGSEARVFVDSTTVVLKPVSESSAIRYTIDGSEPGPQSKAYEKPIHLEGDTTLKARLFTASGLASETSECRYDEIEAGPGLLCDYFEFDEHDTDVRKLPNFHFMSPTLTAVAKGPDPNAIVRRERGLGMVFHGYIDVPEEGLYRFHATSDDGARLIIDERVVIDDPIKHPPHEASGEIDLKRGKRRIELQYFQFKDDMILDLAYTLPSGKRVAVPESAFSFDASTRRDPTRRGIADTVEP